MTQLTQPRRFRLLSATAATGVAVLTSAALVSCSSTGTDGASNTKADPANIVATTSVWADVASAVTGTEVEAIITGTSIDPHHFEPTAADLARVREAGTLVANGGHYDASLYTVAEQDRIIHAIPLQGEEHENHAHEGHDHDSAALPQDLDELEDIWMSPAKVTEMAQQIEQRVGGSAGDVEKRMGALEERLHSFDHVHLAMTEPIAAGLIWGTELHDITPEGYSLATLNEAEPAVSDVAQFLELIESGALDFLVHNPQSTNAATERLVKAAEEKNIPVVEMRETPPEGVDFLDYLEQLVGGIEKVVEGSEPLPDAELPGAAD